jgi:hypothetical protein
MTEDMQIMKKHRFFRKIDWKKLARREIEPPIQPLVTDRELAENFSTTFTDLALSPVLTSMKTPWTSAGANENPFGRFSYVASQSLLDGNGFRKMSVSGGVAV